MDLSTLLEFALQTVKAADSFAIYKPTFTGFQRRPLI